MPQKDNTWSIELKNFNAGFAPLAFCDSLTETGGGGHASTMTNVNVLDGKLTQGYGLANLTGAVTELISYIMDKAVSNNVSYAIGTSSLWQLSATAVSNIHTITGCAEGESIQVLKGNLYYFYNTATEGRIGKYDLSATFQDSWGTGLQIASHPSDKKEDIIVFGNGRYAGTYIAESGDLTPNKLDFGQDASVDDVLYDGGFWYLAVNSGVAGTNRTEGQVYLYDGAAIVSTLADETGVGMFRIGFLYRLNGIKYICYQDLSSTGFIIGYLNGKAIVPLGRFNGTLPNFQQKTLYKNTILFLSSGLVYSSGAVIGELPYQLSQIADGGYATCGAIAAPFGVPMISSTDGSGNFRLAQFSGYDVNCSWKSIVFPLARGRYLGYIDSIVVLTKTLAAGASCSLTIEANQALSTSTAQTIATTGERRHTFTSFNLGTIEDFRIALSWAAGSTTNDCLIRNIKIDGHWSEG